MCKVRYLIHTVEGLVKNVKIKAICASIFAAIVMSTGPVAAKIVLKAIDPYSVMMFSSLLAFISLSIILFLKGTVTPFRAHQGTYIRIAIFFIFVQTIPGIIWFNVLPHIQALFAIMLKRTQPIIVLILSIILGHRKASIGELILSALALFGMFHVIGSNPGAETGGTKTIFIGGAILCVTMWALQFIYARAVFEPLNALEANRAGIGAYVVVIAPIAFILGDPSAILSTDMKSIFALLYMGIMVFGLGLSAIFYALEALEPWNVTMILLLGPIAGAAAAWLILGEGINGGQLAGAALVIFSLILSVIITREPTVEKLPLG